MKRRTFLGSASLPLRHGPHRRRWRVVLSNTTPGLIEEGTGRWQNCLCRLFRDLVRHLQTPGPCNQRTARLKCGLRWGYDLRQSGLGHLPRTRMSPFSEVSRVVPR